MTDSGRLDRIDHLRFVAAAVVMIWHFSRQYVYPPQGSQFPVLSIFANGHTGVALFCVISGFIFTHLYYRQTTIDYGNFAMRRVQRIAPLFIFWLGLTFFYPGSWEYGKMLGTLVTGLVTRGSLPINFNQSWSIFVEIQFYAIFPFLVVFARQFGARYLLALWGLLIVVRFLFFVEQRDVFFLSYHTIFGRLDQFLVGMVLSLLFQSKVSQGRHFRGWAIAAGVAGAALIVLFYMLADEGGSLVDAAGMTSPLWVLVPAIEAVCYAALMAGYLCSPAAPVLRWAGAAAAFLGRIGYSLYLNHQFVFAAIYAVFKTYDYRPQTWDEAALVCIVVGIPLVIAVSIATYYLIEVPFMRLGRSPKPATGPA